MSNSLGKRLQTARKKAGLSTRQLDVAAGLTLGHSWQIESGVRKDPAASTIVAIAKALGVSIDSLLLERKKAA